ncbi:hypothetical protein MBAV_000236, partial [Candidatus Magnetobacterium bavaricum]
MNERQAVTKVLVEMYKTANKKQKKAIINEFIELAGYDRCYAGYLLRIHGKHPISSKVSLGKNKKKQKRLRAKELGSSTINRCLSAITIVWFCRCFDG